jgi:hypothetical protein
MPIAIAVETMKINAMIAPKIVSKTKRAVRIIWLNVFIGLV